jgi:hypothetical protein
MMNDSIIQSDKQCINCDSSIEIYSKSLILCDYCENKERDFYEFQEVTRQSHEKYNKQLSDQADAVLMKRKKILYGIATEDDLQDYQLFEFENKLEE